MKQLERSGLYGAGLLEIRSEHLVGRYNECLQHIGLSPTRRKNFLVDGGGWSPQIAEDFGDTYYLAHGEANQYAIIVTPEQAGLPLYAPTHTFDWYVLQELYQKALDQVTGLTGKTGIVIEIDHGLSGFTDPDDLLMIESVILSAETPMGLMQAAKDQRTLVAKFREVPLAWLDGNLRKQIIASAKTFGDLRQKPLVIPEIPYMDVRSFHTRAFGGIYVLRGVSDGSPLLVCEDKRRSRGGIISLLDKNLPSLIRESGLVEIPIEGFRNKPQKLERIKECLLADAVFQADQDTDWKTLTKAQKRSLVRKLQNQIPREYFEIERLGVVLKNGSDLGKVKLSEQTENLLLRPKRTLSVVAQRALSELHAQMYTGDVWRLYHFRKALFFETYRKWSEAKKK